MSLHTCILSYCTIQFLISPSAIWPYWILSSRACRGISHRAKGSDAVGRTVCEILRLRCAPLRMTMWLCAGSQKSLIRRSVERHLPRGEAKPITRHALRATLFQKRASDNEEWKMKDERWRMKNCGVPSARFYKCVAGTTIIHFSLVSIHFAGFHPPPLLLPSIIDGRSGWPKRRGRKKNRTVKKHLQTLFKSHGFPYINTCNYTIQMCWCIHLHITQ